MGFLTHQTQGNIIPGNEYLPAGAITPVIGLALTVTGGQLAVASGTTVPAYICQRTQEATLTAGDILPVIRVLPDMIFATTWSVAASSVHIGDKVTLSADGLQVTATTTSGVAEVVGMDGTAAGDTVCVRFPGAAASAPAG